MQQRDVSDELRADDAKYAAFVLDALRAASFALDLRARTLSPSPRLNALFGYPADHPLTLEECQARAHPDDLGLALASLPDVGATPGKPVHVEGRILSPIGATRWVIFHGEHVADAAELPVLLRGVFIDITERKQVEAALRMSEARQAFLLRLNDCLRPLVDPAVIQFEAARLLGEHLRASRVAYFEVKGGDYVVERDYVMRVPPIAGRYLVASFGPKLLAAYQAGRAVVELDVTANPDLTPAERAAFESIQIGAYVGVPLVKEGQFVAGLAVHQLTARAWTPEEVALVEETAERTWAAVERARAENARHESEEKYRALTELSSHMVWMLAGDGTISYLSRRWFDYTGIPVDTLQQQGWLRALHPDDRGPISAAFARHLAEGTDYSMEMRLQGKDGAYRWHVSRATPITDTAGTVHHWMGVTFDIDDRKQAEEALRASEAHLQQLYVQEQAARAAAEEASRLKDEFLATVSHELRTPLTAFLGYAELLKRRKRDEGYVARTVEKMVQSAKAQAALIEDLLDISRIVSGKLRMEMAPLDLLDVLYAALNTVRPTAEAKQLSVQLELDKTGGVVLGDANRLQQVIWNLLSNATKFTPPGGQIVVRLAPSGGNIELSVRDTGQGIPASFLPYVFDRFRQADSSSQRSSSGLGLGLAIVRHLVELHGGTVMATSDGVGQGATFTVRLPLPDAHDPVQYALLATGGDAVAGEEMLALRGVRILVVDDQPAIGEVLEELLVADGAVVQVCTSAQEALALLRTSQPDLLVSDVAMPDEDGYWLIEQVRRLPAAEGGLIPAVALTAYVRLEDRLRVLAAGFNQYTPKPIDAAELRAVLKSLVRTQWEA